ncbi:MAG: TonB-dependent receptor plug domain-containing protein [Prolixibacteraceae bacterium]|jgi:TonB-dependent SusC/RagA subfamily outer membrane receptor|nr:TonB-dependent receptor plug domain-containing protein [Prolixibacteraceae bacterium]MBT6005029.1 TonB-dependent receptor plug domain-containing protein [Prolixibacteraceae bacterium]MBT6765192.1 TonB-dependent receptor plug domain-containing protein [Prolixibacteraceae bacterium]MBT6996937.1 TonB-dependent receptor plug domain-containing protein [Prolixibacteraceae bacterium]MBT7395379.1 TonB-dependent receptor plug domain-containing protein [Prolixibacteraceae bacterium]
MLRKIFYLIIFAVFILSSSVLNAQDRVLHGMVTTFDNIPLIGAEIKVNSTKQIFLTDTLGNFSAVCNSIDKLKIDAKGFYSQKAKIESNIKFVAINLKLKSKKNERFYSVGYGYVNEKEKLSAIDGLTNEDIDFNRYNNIAELISGNFSGVQIQNGEIVIRGAASLISSNAALIVVDGVISEQDILNTLHPLDIKSINIIKDGSAAIYGSRGANGVVLIETMKGGELERTNY